MTAKTVLVPFDSSGGDTALAVDFIDEIPVTIRRGEPLTLHATFFTGGTIRTDYTGVITLVCDIYRQGSSELLARASTGTINAITNDQWLTGSYHCALVFTGAGTGNCNPGTIGHDTFIMVCYATTSGGNVALGSGLFVVFGFVTLTNPALPIDALDQIYLKDQDGSTFPVRVNTTSGKTIEIGDEI